MIQPISKAVQKQSKTQECTSSGVPGCESVTENRSDAGVELQVVSVSVTWGTMRVMASRLSALLFSYTSCSVCRV